MVSWWLAPIVKLIRDNQPSFNVWAPKQHQCGGCLIPRIRIKIKSDFTISRFPSMCVCLSRSHLRSHAAWCPSPCRSHLPAFPAVCTQTAERHGFREKITLQIKRLAWKKKSQPTSPCEQTPLSPPLGSLFPRTLRGLFQAVLLPHTLPSLSSPLTSSAAFWGL